MSIFRRNCDGLGRRDFLQLGMGALGGLTLPQIMASQARASVGGAPVSGAGVPPSDLRCILIWLDGGPSHFETFDPKPEAPSEIRGEFNSIPTSVPGVHFCETMPRLAKSFKKFSVIRSIAHNQNNHGAGNHYMMTGRPTPQPVGCGAFVTFHPSLGSVVSSQRATREGMPAYVSMPSISRSGGPNFLGAKHSPFVIGGDPNSTSFSVRDVSLPKEIAEGRAQSRVALRTSLDRMKRIADKAAEDPAVSFDQFYSQGFDLITSKSAQNAFDVNREPEVTRDSYGRHDFGQRLLLARRLTEVGVPFVTVYSGGWDHHSEIFPAFRDTAGPKLDQGVAALINDLDQRGTLDNTIVLVMGEFGRTPIINTLAGRKSPGRDHWSFAMSVLMAGGGAPRGQIVGATDRKGYYASESVYAPEDLAATLYTKMGIDPTLTLHDTAGRPVQLVNNGRLIKEVFA